MQVQHIMATESAAAPCCISLGDWEAAANRVIAAKPSGVHGYFAGGASDEYTLRRNVQAFDAWWLIPRYLVDVASAHTRSHVLGHPTATPFGIAPTAFQRLLHDDGELAVSRAAARAGVPFCVSTFATHSLEDIAGAAGGRGVRFFQLYAMADRRVTRALVQRAEACGGYAGVVLTVDRPVLGRREANLRDKFDVPWELHRDPNHLNAGGLVPGSSPQIAHGAAAIPSHSPRESSAAATSAVAPSALYSAVASDFTWGDLVWLKSVTSLPIVLKGVLSPEDAVLAVQAGVAAVWVSNHGGRQLDSAPGGVDALPSIVAAVRQEEEAGARRHQGWSLWQWPFSRPPPPPRRMQIFVDGGVRRGTDVVKCLALGCDFVFIGRPPLWGLAVDGEAGVGAVLSTLADEVKNALQLIGVNSAGELTPAHVAHAERFHRHHWHTTTDDGGRKAVWLGPAVAAVVGAAAAAYLFGYRRGQISLR